MGLGRVLIVLGLVILAVGLVVAGGERLSFLTGKLPGDIVWRRKNTVFYFPIVSSLLLSLLLSFIFSLFRRR